MPYRVSCGPSVGRTIIVSHSASEALQLFRQLEVEDAENIEISHLELGALSLEQIEEAAKQEAARPGEMTETHLSQ